jgi:hypothetical protein
MYLWDLVKIISLAAVLSRLSKGESRHSLVALAWTLRNREKFRRQASNLDRLGTRNLFFNEAISGRGRSITLRSWNILVLFKLGVNEGFCRSLAIAALVWCGEEADPTAGSIHFHRHDDWPEWAKNSQPVALIGNWFFYNEIDAPQKI